MSLLCPIWAVEVLLVVAIASTLFRSVSATNHSVGGESGWDLLTDLAAWSSQTTVYAGDNLVFIYNPTHDVLEVDQADYSSCRISSPIRAYNDGETVIPLRRPGTRYFICATSGHCQSGMKLLVDVLPTAQHLRRRPPSTPARRSPPANPPSAPAPRRQPAPPAPSPGIGPSPGPSVPEPSPTPHPHNPPDDKPSSPSPDHDLPTDVMLPSEVDPKAAGAPDCLPDPVCLVLVVLLAAMYYRCFLLPIFCA